MLSEDEGNISNISLGYNPQALGFPKTLSNKDFGNQDEQQVLLSRRLGDLTIER